jgi:hypothetical protein
MFIISKLQPDCNICDGRVTEKRHFPGKAGLDKVFQGASKAGIRRERKQW